ncbi:hypothetical protein EJ08DRAFT_389371 [Tothia fuscella]|uniref:Uncharacterized protein n=1 Tax=Tothia fuscella TaxID=1048955 RepID=A0A9P4P1H1_9PEZI|nr:hypothetical protein EJ08DRAFT_389371 [Tothia fuscella]
MPASPNSSAFSSILEMSSSSAEFDTDKRATMTPSTVSTETPILPWKAHGGWKPLDIKLSDIAVNRSKRRQKLLSKQIINPVAKETTDRDREYYAELLNNHKKLKKARLARVATEKLVKAQKQKSNQICTPAIEKELECSLPSAEEDHQEKVTKAPESAEGENDTSEPKFNHIEVKECLARGRMFLWRTHSLDGIHRSSGYSGPVLYLPKSLRTGEDNYISILDLRPVRGQIMLGMHLKWSNPKLDEFLSWTNSLLFSIVHALGRHEKGQEPVLIAFGDISALITPDGQQVPFYPANTLHKVFNVLGRDWGTRDEQKLQPRMSTHEILSFGEMRDPNSAICHVTIEMLVGHGLFQLVPVLKVDGLFKRTGLYESLVALRSKLHYEAEAVKPSTEELGVCQALASFSKHPTANEIPFHAFAFFLAPKKRKITPKYQNWVSANFTAQNAQAGIFPGMNVIADNLPEVAQYYELVKEAGNVLGLTPMLDISLVTGRGGTELNYKGDDKRILKYAVITVELRDSKRRKLTLAIILT